MRGGGRGLRVRGRSGGEGVRGDRVLGAAHDLVVGDPLLQRRQAAGGRAGGELRAVVVDEHQAAVRAVRPRHPHQLPRDSGAELHVRDVLRRIRRAAVRAGAPAAPRPELGVARGGDAGAEEVAARDAAVHLARVAVVRHVARHRGGVAVVPIGEAVPRVAHAGRDVAHVLEARRPKEADAHLAPVAAEGLGRQRASALHGVGEPLLGRARVRLHRGSSDVPAPLRRRGSARALPRGRAGRAPRAARERQHE
mmetsp:Transcript_5074/g.20193  ORF Transcript_5074/g.20193 Transcript_5074/m.20193 type:complete len:252 (+) Transcript_5074:152-907(+)